MHTGVIREFNSRLLGAAISLVKSGAPSQVPVVAYVVGLVDSTRAQVRFLRGFVGHEAGTVETVRVRGPGFKWIRRPDIELELTPREIRLLRPGTLVCQIEQDTSVTTTGVVGEIHGSVMVVTGAWGAFKVALEESSIPQLWPVLPEVGSWHLIGLGEADPEELLT